MHFRSFQLIPCRTEFFLTSFVFVILIFCVSHLYCPTVYKSCFVKNNAATVKTGICRGMVQTTSMAAQWFDPSQAIVYYKQNTHHKYV